MPLRSKDKRSFKRSLKDCLNGFSFVIVNEDNFKREVIIAIIVLIMCFALKLSRLEFVIILLTIGMVLITEVINTAIEKTIDLYTNKYNEIAKIAKDVSAFAVLLTSFFAVIIGINIFGVKILNMLGGI